MYKLLFKIIPAIFFWSVFIFTVLKTSSPTSLSQANIYQISAFFIPLYLALSSTLNLFLKNILISASISLGLIFILILQALDSLNLATGILITIAMYLLISYFRKVKRGSLTKLPKISKITSLTRRKHE